MKRIFLPLVFSVLFLLLTFFPFNAIAESPAGKAFLVYQKEAMPLTITSNPFVNKQDTTLIFIKGIRKVDSRQLGLKKNFWTTKRVALIIGIIVSLSTSLFILWRLLITKKNNKKLTILLDNLSEFREELDKDRNRLLTIINNLPDLVYVKDRESRFVIANPALAEFMGAKSPEGLIGKTDFDFYPEEMASQLFNDEQEIVKTGEPIIQQEEHIYNLSGVEKWFSTSKVLLRDNNGNIIGIVGVGRDISDKKIAENELEKQKDRIKQYLDIVDVIIVVLDRKGRIQLLNRKGCEIIGVREEDVIRKDWFNLCLPEHERDKIRNIFKEIISGKLEHFSFNKNEIITANGEKKIIAWHNTLIKDEEGKIVGSLSSGEDITDRLATEESLREAEKSLRISQRLEAIGRLTSGIAHDFNNLLTVIIGYSDILKMRGGEDAPYIKEVEEIKKAGKKAVNLINQLLAFSKKQMMKPKIISLNKLIKDIEKILRRTIGENIELITKLEDDLGNIKADPTQIEQILMNLAVNAKQAMPDGGILTVETRNAYLDENYTLSHPDVKVGHYVLISVTDTGAGMDEKIKDHIFEPFFTTNKDGLGTGLGLSTIYGIVKQNEGSIWVYSEIGKGTVFKIYLPQIFENEKKGEREAVITSGPRGNSEKVILVEDEDQVRNVILSVLSSAGYDVIVAKNGEEGLKTIEEIGFNNIDLIITDMIMPKMGGYELITKLKSFKPQSGMNVLFISGYSNIALSKNEFNKKEFSILQKPFSASHLLKKVKEIIDKS